MTRLINRLWITTLLVWTASCDPGEEPAGTRDSIAPLLEGRAFTIVLYDQTPPRRVRLAFGTDGRAEQVVAVVDAWCRADLDLDNRFVALYQSDALQESNGSCGAKSASEQQVRLCRGHMLQTLADTVAPVDFFVDGQKNLASVPSAAVVRMRMREPGAEPSIDGRQPLFTITPPDASDAATLSLVATVAFQHAALLGAHAIDTLECPDGTLSGTVPASREDGVWSEVRVPLGFVVASATNEAVHGMRESASSAGRYITAAAADALDADRDRARAIAAHFRGRHDSRLELTNLFLGVPRRLFDPVLDGSLGSDASASMEERGELPVCEAHAASDAERRAEDLIRGERVDPHLAGPELESAIRNALGQDYPDVFGDASLAGLSNTQFIETLGVRPADLHAAAARIVREAAVLGRPILPVETDAGGVTRVVGTARPLQAAPGAFLVATTAGAARIAFDEVPQQRPTRDYGLDVILSGTTPAQPDYALGSLFATIDTVAAAAALAGDREDLRRPAAGAAAYTEALALFQDLFVFGREEVSYRLDVCIGQRVGDGGIDTVRIELLGSGSDADRYELWWSEVGLQCAVRGNVEGIPCDEALLRLSAEPSVETDGQRSGFVPQYLRWNIGRSDVPLLAGSSGTGLPVGQRIYVTKRADSSGGGVRRIAIGGFSLLPGDGVGTFSRCTQLPAGPAVMDEIEDELGASADDCTRAEVSCAGLSDVRLPLEDELTEAMEGRDDIESSFFHYLRLARSLGDEADRLGQELIENGLSMDLRAEAAADALSDLCGPVVNVASIPGAQVDAACTTDADCPDPAAQQCVGTGRCQPIDAASMLTGAGPEAEALRRCLGEEGELITVSLGSDPVCFYRRPGGGPACACDPDVDGVTCPPCPAFDCTSDAYRRLETLGWTVHTVEATLDLVDPAVGGAAVGSCGRFARLVAGSGPPPDSGQTNEAMVEEILAEEWLSHANILQTVETLGFEESALEMDALVRSGRRWASTGSLRSGPSVRWPCRPMDPADSDAYMQICASPATGERAMRCERSCATIDDRAAANGELQHMLGVLATLAGARMASPHAVRHRTGVFLDSVVTDLSEPIRDDDTYCSRLSLTAPCLTRVLHNQVLPCRECTQRVATHCVLVSSTSGEAEVNAVTQQLGICPTGILQHEGSPWSWGERRTAVRWWAPDAEVDRAIREYARGRVAPTAVVPWLRVAPVGTRLTEDGFVGATDLLTQETGWYREDVTYGELMRALELACLATGSGGVTSCGDAATLPTVRSLEDLSALSARLRCAADGFERLAERLILENVPADVAEQLRTGAIAPTYPTYRGEYGSSVGELRAELESLPEATRTIGSVLRSFAGEVEIARSQLTTADLEAQIDAWQLAANLADQAARCASAYGGIETVGNATGAVAQCAAAAVNIASAIATTIIRGEIREESVAQIGTGVAIRFGERMDQLQQAQSNLARGFSRVNAILARMETQRSQARRHAARVLFLDEDAVGREYQVNRVMRARMNTLRVRYERAHRNAIRLAYLARRAIEQRLGVDLSTMTEDMTLVPAPATWADGLCSMRGIDYAELRGDGDTDVTDYADRFVGDYVRLLELFIESYRLDYPFTDGDDVALVSLRDDILGARRTCSVVGHNLFTWSTDFTHDGDSAVEQAGGWATDCVEGERCPVATVEDGSPFRDDAQGIPGTTDRVTRLRAMGESRAVALRSACPPAALQPDGSCTAPAGGSRYQDVVIQRGDHLLSWYERLPVSLATSERLAMCTDADCVSGCIAAGGSMESCAPECVDPACIHTACAAVPLTDITGLASAFEVALYALDTEGLPTLDGAPTWRETPRFIEPAGDPWIDACNWRRVAGRLTNPAARVVRVAFGVIVPSATSPEVGGVLSAPQLEALDPGIGAMSVAPLSFFPTWSDFTANVGLCEDTTGEIFRSERYWVRGCEHVCPDGLGASCSTGGTADRSLLRCYRETRFAVSLDDIDRGRLIPTGGFALGNFNYRYRTFAVNLVGTGVRDCSTAESSSSCYASGYIPYSLRHAGPFRVRNHWGDVVEAPLFIGNVVFAKALAAERYLTNPLSSADRALLADYQRTELRGRPLDGSYRLRIYDADGFDWERVEDVQIILDYRYWTRFE